MDELLKAKPVFGWGYAGYGLAAVLVPLAIRGFMSAIETCRLRREPYPLSPDDGTFGKIFWGVGRHVAAGAADEKLPADYGLAFLLGVLEMLAYPLILKADQPSFIGAWLAFKTVNRWSYAPDIPRGPYNRYLVANAIVLLASYLVARWFF